MADDWTVEAYTQYFDGYIGTELVEQYVLLIVVSGMVLL